MGNSLTALVRIGSKTVHSKLRNGSIKHVPCDLDGCTLYLPMAEKSFNFTFDHSGKSNHGTVYGVSEIVGTIRNGLNFDGVDDYVDLVEAVNLMPTNAITLYAWIKTDMQQGSYNNEGRIINIHRVLASPSTLAAIYAGEPAGDGVGNRDSICFLYYNGTDHKWLCYQTSSPLYYDGNPHLIAATHDGTTIKLYYDGIEVASRVDTLGQAGNIKSKVGSFNGATRFFNDIIDEVRVYNRVLSPEEILVQYEQEK